MRRAGMSRPAGDAEIMRAARMFLEAPEAGIAHVWRYVTGLELGAGRVGRDVRVRIMTALLAIAREELRHAA